MPPCRRCSPRESDMSRCRSSEQAARASRKQTARVTSSGGIADNRHPTRQVPSQCSGRRHSKRMGPGLSSDPSSLLRTVKPSLERLYYRKRRLSNSGYLRSRRLSSSTCPLNPTFNSSDLRNRRPNNSALHSRLLSNNDPHSHSQRLSSNVCPHNIRFKNNVLPRNLLLNNPDPHNLPLSNFDPLSPHHNTSVYPHSLERPRVSMAVRSHNRPRPNHECIHKSSYQKRLPCISLHPRSAPILLRKPFLPSSPNCCSRLRTNTLQLHEAWGRCSYGREGRPTSGNTTS